MGFILLGALAVLTGATSLATDYTVDCAHLPRSEDELRQTAEAMALGVSALIEFRIYARNGRCIELVRALPRPKSILDTVQRMSGNNPTTYNGYTLESTKSRMVLVEHTHSGRIEHTVLPPDLFRFSWRKKEDETRNIADDPTVPISPLLIALPSQKRWPLTRPDFGIEIKESHGTGKIQVNIQDWFIAYDLRMLGYAVLFELPPDSPASLVIGQFFNSTPSHCLPPDSTGSVPCKVSLTAAQFRELIEGGIVSISARTSIFEMVLILAPANGVGQQGLTQRREWRDGTLLYQVALGDRFPRLMQAEETLTGALLKLTQESGSVEWRACSSDLCGTPEVKLQRDNFVVHDHNVAIAPGTVLSPRRGTQRQSGVLAADVVVAGSSSIDWLRGLLKKEVNSMRAMARRCLPASIVSKANVEAYAPVPSEPAVTLSVQIRSDENTYRLFSNRPTLLDTLDLSDPFIVETRVSSRLSNIAFDLHASSEKLFSVGMCPGAPSILCLPKECDSGPARTVHRSSDDGFALQCRYGEVVLPPSFSDSYIDFSTYPFDFRPGSNESSLSDGSVLAVYKYGEASDFSLIVCREKCRWFDMHPGGGLSEISSKDDWTPRGDARFLGAREAALFVGENLRVINEGIVTALCKK